jgi:hypothetical protein
VALAAYVVLAMLRHLLECVLELLLGRGRQRLRRARELVPLLEFLQLDMVRAHLVRPVLVLAQLVPEFLQLDLVRAHLVRPVLVLAQLVPALLRILRPQVNGVPRRGVWFLFQVHGFIVQDLPQPDQV